MTRTRCFTILAGLSGLALLTALAGRGWGDDAPKPKPADRTKKEVIERPTAAIVANSSAPAAPKEDPANPKVKPGDVKWHASFADALLWVDQLNAQHLDTEALGCASLAVRAGPALGSFCGMAGPACARSLYSCARLASDENRPSRRRRSGFRDCVSRGAPRLLRRRHYGSVISRNAHRQLSNNRQGHGRVGDPYDHRHVDGEPVGAVTETTEERRYTRDPPFSFR